MGLRDAMRELAGVDFLNDGVLDGADVTEGFGNLFAHTAADEGLEWFESHHWFEDGEMDKGALASQLAKKARVSEKQALTVIDAFLGLPAAKRSKVSRMANREAAHSWLKGAFKKALAVRESRALGEELDGEARTFLADKLAAMDERAGAVRADLNDLVREGLDIAESARETGADDAYWKAFKAGAKKVMEGFVELTQALQQAREAVGYETDENASTVTEVPGQADEGDEGEAQTESVDGGMAGWLKGLDKAAKTWAKKVQGKQAAAVLARLQQAIQQAQGAMVVKQAAVESVDAGDDDPIAAMALAQARGVPLSERGAHKPSKVLGKGAEGGDEYEVLKVAKKILGDKKPREVNHVTLSYADAVNILQAYELLGPEKGKKLVSLPMREVPSTAQSVVVKLGGNKARKGLPSGTVMAGPSWGYEGRRNPSSLDDYLNEMDDRDAVLDDLATFLDR